jgi:hypothetical protein
MRLKVWGWAHADRSNATRPEFFCRSTYTFDPAVWNPETMQVNCDHAYRQCGLQAGALLWLSAVLLESESNEQERESNQPSSPARTATMCM